MPVCELWSGVFRKRIVTVEEAELRLTLPSPLFMAETRPIPAENLSTRIAEEEQIIEEAAKILKEAVNGAFHGGSD